MLVRTGFISRISMSLFNDVLDIIHLDVEVYHNARVCGDWQITEHSLGATCFHMPTQGSCLLSVPDEGEWCLNEGDLVIFPKELPHTMVPLYPSEGCQQHLPIQDSQHISGTSMLCGKINYRHAGGEHLMTLLPNVLVVEADKSRQWLGPVTDLIVLESLQGSGMKGPVLNRLCELLMVYALRCYAERYVHHGNLLALYSHSKLFNAVHAIHSYPEHSWTLASLANESAMSRTRFAELFSREAGITATQYLMWWRMQLAWTKLSAGDTVESVSESVGYRSEAAFSRAFKKTFGKTVGSVRAIGNTNR